MDPNSLFGLVTTEAAREGVRFLVRAAGSKALGTIREWLQDFREENTEKFFQEFYSMVNPLGIVEPRQISPKIWYRILEGASLEDDEFLRKRYAAMLANAMDPDFKVSIQPMFVEILKVLSVVEVRFLDRLYRTTNEHSIVNNPDLLGPAIQKAADECAVPDTDVLTLVESLQRHGLLKLTGHPQSFTILRSVIDDSLARYTRLGYEFVTACSAPRPRSR